MPTIVVMFILSTGNVMTAGFNQIFNLSNDAVKNVSETLDMYIYNISFKAAPDFGYSTALSLFRSVVNLTLLVFANTVSFYQCSGNFTPLLLWSYDFSLES